MIKEECFITPPLDANSYLVYDDESKNGLIIDLGGDFFKIKAEAERLGVILKAVLFTHGHFDHTSGGADAKRLGVPVYVSKEDENKLSGENALAREFGFDFVPFKADKTFSDGEVLNIGGIEVKAIKTAGHTEGSYCFIIGDKLFTGDTLFYLSFGRSDLAGGNFQELKKSLYKLFSMEKDYEVLAGHGRKTSLFFERKNNCINDYFNERR